MLFKAAFCLSQGEVSEVSSLMVVGDTSTLFCRCSPCGTGNCSSMVLRLYLIKGRAVKGCGSTGKAIRGQELSSCILTLCLFFMIVTSRATFSNSSLLALMKSYPKSQLLDGWLLVQSRFSEHFTLPNMSVIFTFLSSDVDIKPNGSTLIVLIELI